MFVIKTVLCIITFGTMAVRVQAGSITDINGLLPYTCSIYECDEGTCESDGSCTCTPNMGYGPQCIPQSLMSDGACSGCIGAGAATNGVGAELCDGSECLCSEGYTGASCDSDMVSISCTSEDMTVTVEGYGFVGGGGFEGIFYMDDSDTFDFTSSCSSTAGTSPFTFDTVNYDGSQSGGNCDGIDPTDGSSATLQGVWVYIQHREDYQSDDDLLVRVECDTELGISTGAIANAVTVGQNSYTASDTQYLSTTRDVSPAGVIMSLKMFDGSNYANINSAVDVGDSVSLVIEHATLPFNVKSCTAYSYDTTGSAPGDGGRSLPLVVDWCIPRAASSLVRGDLFQTSAGSAISEGGSADSNNLVRLDLTAWYFIGDSHDVYIVCDVCFGEACENGASPPSNCDNSLTDAANAALWFSSARRRRREVPGTIDSISSLSVSVPVYHPNSAEGKRARQGDAGDVHTDTSDTSCYKKLSVLLPIIVLTVLLLVTMLTAVFFCRKTTYIHTARDCKRSSRAS